MLKQQSQSSLVEQILLVSAVEIEVAVEIELIIINNNLFTYIAQINKKLS